MLDISQKENCSGCHACVNACPKGAISMATDGEGFLYPEIDKAACMDCGLCEKMCQTVNPIYANVTPAAYACHNRDKVVRMSSSSGGMFHAMAEWIIGRGGIVFGAAFDKALMVRHIAVDTMEQLYRMQGSKYVQSTIGSTYSQAKKLLDEGRYVLFTGTPCQINGLLHFLRKDYERLYTQDIICHGVPSHKVWKKYIDYQTKVYHEPVAREPLPSFRRKDEGWKRYSLSLHFGKDSEYLRFHREDFYMQAFLNNLSLRPSCYACHSKTKLRSSDITLADFWGVESVCPELFDNKGTSLVLANSEKGKQLFEELKGNLSWRQVDFETAISKNTPAFQSVAKPPKRADFFARLDAIRFDRLVKRETLPPLYVRGYWKIRQIIGTICRKLHIVRA